jgi:glycosyltransferase involved in cell wall biosynthesis
MSIPEVTVLTAVRNGARYISETIASIQAQTFSKWEYIIVDDNSTDNTVEFIEAARKADPRIVLLRRDVSAGPYVAANDGLRQARCKYIVRIDADDLCPSSRIERQLEFLTSHPEYRACVSYWQAFNGRGLVPNSITTIPSNPRVFRWALLLRAPSIHSSVCIEREAMDEIGGYRELRLSQDYRLWCELTRRGWLGTIPEVLCYVRYHEKRQSSQHKRLQIDLAMEILSDHFTALTGESWPLEKLEALRAVGMSLPGSVDMGIEMLDRWDQFWQADCDLTTQDRDELARMSAFRRWKHLRSNARTQPFRALRGLLKIATAKNRFLSAPPTMPVTRVP